LTDFRPIMTRNCNAWCAPAPFLVVAALLFPPPASAAEDGRTDGAPSSQAAPPAVLPPPATPPAGLSPQALPPVTPTPSFPDQPAPPSKSGFFEQFGRWWEDSVSNFNAGMKKAQGRFTDLNAQAQKDAAAATEEAVKNAAEAATAVVRLPNTRIIELR
jgi:hypothetical protein